MIRFFLLLILFALLFRLIARFVLLRFMARHMPPPPSNGRDRPLDRIREAEYVDVTDDN